MSVVGDIEAALFAHWSMFGRPPMGELHDRDGLLWFETAIPRVPFNGVIRTRLGDDGRADEAIAERVGHFRSRGADFMWVAHPSATPGDLSERLAANGLAPVEEITCMALDLDEWQPPRLPEGAEFEEIGDEAGVRVYSDLTIEYWDVAPEYRASLIKFHSHWGVRRAPGRRFLARIGDEPVGKGYLSLAGPPGVAAIYGMSVRPAARGRGVAGGLTSVILARAKELGCHRAVLHSTPMAVNVYRRAGFAPECDLTVHATAPLWSGEH